MRPHEFLDSLITERAEAYVSARILCEAVRAMNQPTMGQTQALLQGRCAAVAERVERAFDALEARERTLMGFDTVTDSDTTTTPEE